MADPIRMTRAEYEATYGAPPPVASEPLRMTRAEYAQTYGGVPGQENEPSAPQGDAFFGGVSRAMNVPMLGLPISDELIGGAAATIAKGANMLGFDPYNTKEKSFSDIYSAGAQSVRDDQAALAQEFPFLNKVLAGTELAGAVGKNVLNTGLSKLTSGIEAVSKGASKLPIVGPALGFMGQRAADASSGAIGGALGGYFGSEGEDRLKDAKGAAIGGGLLSAALGPVGRFIAPAEEAAQETAGALKMKALGLTAKDVSKAAQKNPSQVIEEGAPVTLKHVEKILSDVDASTAPDYKTLYQRILNKKSELGDKYDEIMDVANAYRISQGKESIKITPDDTKVLTNWIDNEVATPAKSEMRKLLNKTIKEFNSGDGPKFNPFRQLQNDRIALNTATDKLAVGDLDKFNQKLRSVLGAKLKTSLERMKDPTGKSLAQEFTQLNADYAPYAALSKQAAKTFGSELTADGLENILGTLRTSQGLGGVLLGAATVGPKAAALGAVTGIPSLLKYRSPMGKLELADSLEGAGPKLLSKAGKIMPRVATGLAIQQGAGLGRRNAEYRKGK